MNIRQISWAHTSTRHVSGLYVKVFTGGLFLNLGNANGSPSVMSTGMHDTIQGSSR